MRYVLVGGGAIEATTKLGEGGEGVVFAAADGASAVKIYHTPLNGAAADKLERMVGREIGPLAGHAAWPVALIAGPGGSIAGLVMPKATEAFDIHTVYSPRDRIDRLPAADWKYLVQVAMNICAAVHAAHGAGVVIGDVNHGSVRVGADGRIRLIDCDSFQIEDAGVTYRCSVGVDAYTPPELQGVRLADIDRTVEHDRFGLAVLVFQLLMMGRHPFSGVPVTSGAPTDIPTAIKRRAYAYQAKPTVLSPPPSAPKLSMLSPALADLFERAFVGKGSRPAASDWHRELAAFADCLSVCPKNRLHRTPPHLANCPWCAFEQAGVDFFSAQASSAGLDEDRFDPAALAQAWRRVETVRAAVAAIPSANVSGQGGGLHVDIEQYLEQARLAAPDAGAFCVWMGRLRKTLLLVTAIAACTELYLEGAIAGALVFAAGAAIIWILSWRMWELDGELRQAREAMEREARPVPAAAVAAMDEMALRGETHRNKAGELAREIADQQRRLRSAPRDLQLHAFLEKFPITSGCAPGIGASRVAQLTSFGIDTAADLEMQAILGVPGFGPAFATALLGWRRGLEQRFRFDPSKKPDPRDVARLAKGSRAQIRRYWKEVQAIRQIATHLEQGAAPITQGWAQREAKVERSAEEIARMEADREALCIIGKAA